VWNFLVRHILRDRIVILIAVGLMTAFMGFMATKVKLQYESSSILPKKDSTNIVYQSFIKQFGQDGTIMFIGIVDTDFFRLPHFNSICDLTDSLKKISGVAEIVSISRLYNLVKNDSLKKFEFIPVLKTKPVSQQELDSVRSIILSLPFYEGLVYNRSTSAYLMALTLDKNTVQSKDRVRLINEIKAMVDRFSARSNIEVHYSGLPYIRTLIAKKLESELRLFIILALMISAAFLYIFFRSTKAVIFPMLGIGAHGPVWLQDYHAHFHHPSAGHCDRS
jgi:predicted RND superfamily exporter protein